MKTSLVILALVAAVCCFSFSLRQKKEYKSFYLSSLSQFKQEEEQLLHTIRYADLSNSTDIKKIKEEIVSSRSRLKGMDFWLRYFDPISYRKLNGPLPVEWETEVFEKFEAPYKRKGAGLSLAEMYLDEETINKDTLSAFIQTSLDSLSMFTRDSVLMQLDTDDHFFLANRLYLLNLAAIYTTGFECPDTARIIPELRMMMHEVKNIYTRFNADFSVTPLSADYLSLYDNAIDFADRQPAAYSAFDQFSFLKDYINPLFRLNQRFIQSYDVISLSYNDYALNNEVTSVFDKSLFISQNTKGIFSLVEDSAVLNEIKRVGKLLFYDPIISGNNKRSCASCHKPTEYFTDTTMATPFQFDEKNHLPRNAPSLINSVFNHLVMLDGKHISLQDQARGVMSSHEEMSSDPDELVKKIMSCKEYRNAFKKFVKYTPEDKNPGMSHIISAITYYYADFSNYYSPFDNAMNNNSAIAADARRGFNLFMSKAQCATCHFVPHFNGIKPPYIGSEFEVLGVPSDTAYTRLSDDKGRYDVNPAEETLHAFRTATVRNAEFTKPYMHNGVFNTLDQVIDFYDVGGGTGKKLIVPNQTLSSDSLKLTRNEKNDLKAFMHSLNENIIFDTPPAGLPVSSDKSLNNRKPGGEY
ncbi:MAG: cytochrome c peroxidase [Chitinophagaceae bacterium]